MNIKKGLDLKYNQEAICPYCGHEQHDSWEFNLKDGDSDITTCANCDHDFKVIGNVEITYSTERI